VNPQRGRLRYGACPETASEHAMKNWLNGLFRSGAAKEALLTRSEFQEEFVELLEKRVPDVRVFVQRELELKIVRKDGSDYNIFLRNAYQSYQGDPKSKEDVMVRFLRAFIEDTERQGQGLDRERIVPVIKGTAFVTSTTEMLRKRGQPFTLVHESYNPELVILYAEDRAGSMRYLTEDNLKELGMSLEELRALAIQNLRRLIGDSIQLSGQDGVFMMTAGGDYDASLLLAEPIWTSGQVNVSGDIVVAIPVRGALLVTGNDDPEKIKTMREIARVLSHQAPYQLTDKLFVFRGGHFEVFEG
jgi:uncharacterized protein YtpQ (UPF0354 family)